MTAALHLASPPDDADLTALEHAVEFGLTAALDSLTRLRQLDAHTRRGFDLWHSYVVGRFGDLLRRLRLPDGERLALVHSMCTKTADHPRGLPVRAQAAVLGVAIGTVQNDRRALGLAPALAPKPEALPAPTGRVWEQTAEWLRRAAAGQLRGMTVGLTLVELAKVAGWTEGKASGALSDVCRRQLALRTEDRRAGQRVHVAAPDGVG